MRLILSAALTAALVVPALAAATDPLTSREAVATAPASQSWNSSGSDCPNHDITCERATV